MIKIVYSEVECPSSGDEAIDLDHSTGVRAVNTSSNSSAILHLLDETGVDKTITLVPLESLILKKTLATKVWTASEKVRISGVSIY